MTRYGIELENYCSTQGWGSDLGVAEARSPVFTSFNELLNYVDKKLKDKKNELIFHSHPKNKQTSCSAHIHRTPVYYALHDNLFKLINVYQFFFKNSPLRYRNKNVLSYRHLMSRWCYLIRLNYSYFSSFQRGYYALTPNDIGTIEFRYNDFPKSYNQLALYFYLSEIASKISEDMENPFEIPLLKINTTDDLEKPIINESFSLFNLNSVDLINADYPDILKVISKDITDLFPKWRFYDFYSKEFTNFKSLIDNMFKKEKRIFYKFFDTKMTDMEWSDYWKGEFFKEIPKKRIIQID